MTCAPHAHILADMHPAELTQPDRYPLSAQYDPAWILSLDMGPHPLWQLEDLLRDLDLSPGSRVLDLGCGKGATSVFLVRECDVDVVAFDLWIEEDVLRSNLQAQGVLDRVTPVNGDVRDAPFEDGAFDAIVSIDAFEYFGTDVRLIPSLVRLLKRHGGIGMTTPDKGIDGVIRFLAAETERVPTQVRDVHGRIPQGVPVGRFRPRNGIQLFAVTDHASIAGVALSDRTLRSGSRPRKRSSGPWLHRPAC